MKNTCAYDPAGNGTPWQRSGAKDCDLTRSAAFIDVNQRAQRSQHARPDLGADMEHVQWVPVAFGLLAIAWGLTCVAFAAHLKLPDGTRWRPLFERRRRMTPREIRMSGPAFIIFGIRVTLFGALGAFG